MRRVALYVCLALVAPTGAVVAQQRDTARTDTTRRSSSAPAPDSTKTSRLAPMVVTGSRVSGVDERTPVQVDDIDRSTAPSGPAAVHQLLARLPGVNLADDQGSRLQPELDVRGFTVSPVIGQPQGVSVFLDGVRINEPDAQEVNFDLIPMDAVSHAELVRGPSAIFGKNSLAGSLLLFTDRGQRTPRLSAQLEGGPYGYRGGRVMAGGALGEVDGFLLARLADEDGWRQATGARTRMVFANVGRKRDSSDVALTVMYAKDRLSQAGSLPESYLRVDRRLNYTPGDFFEPSVWHLALRGEREVASGQLRGNVFWRRNAYEQYNGNIPPPNSDGFVRNLSAGGLIEWAWPTRIGGAATTVTVGAEYSHADVTYRFLAVQSPGVPSDSADLADLGCEIPSGLCTHVETKEDNAALYAQAIVSLTPSLSLTGALRGDYVRIPITDLLTPENGGTSTYWRASPKLGLNYRFSDDLRGYVAFNTGFRAPAALELSCADATAPCTLPFALGADPPLRPVKVYDYEAGIDLEPAPRTNLDVVGFLSDVHDDILFVQPTATTGFFQNVARTRRAGVEMSGALGLPAGLRLFGSYAYLVATYRTTVHLASALEDEPSAEPGDHFPTSPTHRGSVGVGLTRAIPRGALDAAVELRAVSGQYLRGDEANTQPQLPGYSVTDVRVSAYLPHVTVRGYVTNLFNKRYVNFGVYAQNVKGPLGGPPPADPEDAPVERFLTPGQPRLFTVSVSLER
ncbi:MAG: TonB-dependent receptor [Gemmatimonadaceae bacterium]|nr:TonB-dependent receptor [Gemmatimonadaceae bacterium]